jgi:hypothetical protein
MVKVFYLIIRQLEKTFKLTQPLIQQLRIIR